MKNRKIMSLFLAVVFFTEILQADKASADNSLRVPLAGYSEDLQKSQKLDVMKRFLDNFEVLTTLQFVRKWFDNNGNLERMYGSNYMKIRKMMDFYFNDAIKNGRVNMKFIRELDDNERGVLRDYLDKIIFPEIVNSVSLSILRKTAVSYVSKSQISASAINEEMGILLPFYLTMRGDDYTDNDEFLAWVFDIANTGRIKAYSSQSEFEQSKFYMLGNQVTGRDILLSPAPIASEFVRELGINSGLKMFTNNEKITLLLKKSRIAEEGPVTVIVEDAGHFTPAIYDFNMSEVNRYAKSVSVNMNIIEYDVKRKLLLARDMYVPSVPYDSKLLGRVTESYVNEIRKTAGSGINGILCKEKLDIVARQSKAFIEYENNYKDALDKLAIDFIGSNNIGMFPDASGWLELLYTLVCDCKCINELKGRDDPLLFGLKLLNHYVDVHTVNADIITTVILSCMTIDKDTHKRSFDLARFDSLINDLYDDTDRLLREVTGSVRALFEEKIKIERVKKAVRDEFILQIKEHCPEIEIDISGEKVVFKIPMEQMEAFLKLDYREASYLGSIPFSEDEYYRSTWGKIFASIANENTGKIVEVDSAICNLINDKHKSGMFVLDKLVNEKLGMAVLTEEDSGKIDLERYGRMFSERAVIKAAYEAGFQELEDFENTIAALEKKRDTVTPLATADFIKYRDSIDELSDITGILFSGRIVRDNQGFHINGRLEENEKEFLQKVVKISAYNAIDYIGDAVYRWLFHASEDRDISESGRNFAYENMVIYVKERIFGCRHADMLYTEKAENYLRKDAGRINEALIQAGVPSIYHSEDNIKGKVIERQLSIDLDACRFRFLGHTVNCGQLVEAVNSDFVSKGIGINLRINIVPGRGYPATIGIITGSPKQGIVELHHIGKTYFQDRGDVNQFVDGVLYLDKDAILDSLRNNFEKRYELAHILYNYLVDKERGKYEAVLSEKHHTGENPKNEVKDLFEKEEIEIVGQHMYLETVGEGKAMNAKHFFGSAQSTWSYIKGVKAYDEKKAERLWICFCNNLLDMSAQKKYGFDNREYLTIIPFVTECIKYNGQLYVDWKVFENIPAAFEGSLGKFRRDRNAITDDKTSFTTIAQYTKLLLGRFVDIFGEDALVSIFDFLIPCIGSAGNALQSIKDIKKRIREKYDFREAEIEVMVESFVDKGWMVKTDDGYSLAEKYYSRLFLDNDRYIMDMAGEDLKSGRGRIAYALWQGDGVDSFSPQRLGYDVDIGFAKNEQGDYFGIFKTETNNKGQLLIGRACYHLGQKYKNSRVYIIKKNTRIYCYMAEDKTILFNDTDEGLNKVSYPVEIALADNERIIRTPIAFDMIDNLPFLRDEDIAGLNPDVLSIYKSKLDNSGNWFPLGQKSLNYYEIGRQFGGQDVIVMFYKERFYGMVIPSGPGTEIKGFGDNTNNFKSAVEYRYTSGIDVARKPNFQKNQKLKMIIEDIQINKGIGFYESTHFSWYKLISANEMNIEEINERLVWGIFKLKVEDRGILRVSKFSKGVYRFSGDIKDKLAGKDVILWVMGDKFGVYYEDDFIFGHATAALSDVSIEDLINSEFDIVMERPYSYKNVTLLNIKDPDVAKLSSVIDKVEETASSTYRILVKESGIEVCEGLDGIRLSEEGGVLIGEEFLKEASVKDITLGMLNALWNKHKSITDGISMRLEFMNKCLDKDMGLIGDVFSENNPLNPEYLPSPENANDSDKILEYITTAKEILKKKEVIGKILKKTSLKSQTLQAKVKSGLLYLMGQEGNKKRDYYWENSAINNIEDIFSQDGTIKPKFKIKAGVGLISDAYINVMYGRVSIKRTYLAMDKKERSLRPQVIVVFNFDEEKDKVYEVVECYDMDGNPLIDNYLNVYQDISYIESKYRVNILDKLEFKPLEEVKKMCAHLDAYLKKNPDSGRYLLETFGLEINYSNQFLLDFASGVFPEDIEKGFRIGEALLKEVLPYQLLYEEDIMKGKDEGFQHDMFIKYLRHVALPAAKDIGGDIEGSIERLGYELVAIRNSMLDYFAVIEADKGGMILIEESNSKGYYYNMPLSAADYYKQLAKKEEVRDERPILIVSGPAEEKEPLSEEVPSKELIDEEEMEMLKLIGGASNFFNQYGFNRLVYEKLNSIFSKVRANKAAVENLKIITQLLIDLDKGANNIKIARIEKRPAGLQGSGLEGWLMFLNIHIDDKEYVGKIVARPMSSIEGEARFQCVLWPKGGDLKDLQQSLIRIAIDYSAYSDNIELDIYIKGDYSRLWVPHQCLISSNVKNKATFSAFITALQRKKLDLLIRNKDKSSLRHVRGSL